MRVTVTTLSDDIFTLEVSPDMELDNLKVLCEFESGIQSHEIVVVHEGRPLQDGRTALSAYGIKDGDMLLIQKWVSQPQQTVTDPNGASSGSENDPRHLRQMLLNNPEQMALLNHNNPRLAEALLSGDLNRFAVILREQQNDRAERERQRIRIINADPFDPVAQRLIAEEIRQENVELNMELAMEFHPESFGQVAMLYINCMVNDHPVKAFIDSGAQSTIMSQACAKRCNIMRLVDRRWAGIAKGVGTQRIIGRIHVVQIQIGKDFLTSSFSILENQPMDMLLGLDMLKRHQCLIDLKRNVLVIGTTGTETRFLAEREIPDCSRPPGGSSSTGLEQEEEQQLSEALDRSSQPSGGWFGCNLLYYQNFSILNNSEENLLVSDKFKETDVVNLIKLGFPRNQILDELRRFNGDSKQAIAALMSKSHRFL